MNQSRYTDKQSLVDSLFGLVDFFDNQARLSQDEHEHTREIIKRLETENSKLQQTLKENCEQDVKFSKLTRLRDVLDRVALEDSIREIHEATVQQDAKNRASLDVQERSKLREDSTAVGMLPSIEEPIAARKPDPVLAAMNDEDALVVLVNTKFKALEDLVFVLKKRILQFEQNTQIMGALDDHGTIEKVMAANESLALQNTKLKLREHRYQVEPLLRRRPQMNAENATFLVMALQVCKPKNRTRKPKNRT
jgi:hypothetical protein